MPGAEARDEPARGIEFQQRRDARAIAGNAAAALEDPHGLAVAIDVDAIGLAHLPAGGKLAEILDLVWIGKVV